MLPSSKLSLRQLPKWKISPPTSGVLCLPRDPDKQNDDRTRNKHNNNTFTAAQTFLADFYIRCPACKHRRDKVILHPRLNSGNWKQLRCEKCKQNCVAHYWTCPCQSSWRECPVHASWPMHASNYFNFQQPKPLSVKTKNSNEKHATRSNRKRSLATRTKSTTLMPKSTGKRKLDQADIRKVAMPRIGSARLSSEQRSTTDNGQPQPLHLRILQNSKARKLAQRFNNLEQNAPT